MGVKDDVVVVYDEKHADYHLVRGRETYYDDDFYLRVWETEDEAIQWAIDNIPNARIRRLNGKIISHRVKKDGEQLGWELE